MWETLSAMLLAFLQEWGDVALFVVFLLEEAGVPLPLPSDLALVWAGSRVAAGESLFIVSLAVVDGATLLGASALYWLARRGGRPLLMRYSRVLHLDASTLLRAERWVQRNGARAVIMGRIVPGFRITTPVAAGVFGVPYFTFLPALIAGTTITTAFWITLGRVAGPRVMAVVQALATPRLAAQLAVSALLLGALVVLTWQMRRRVLPSWRGAAFHLRGRRQVEAAALAGLLATFEMAAAVGILLTVLLALRAEAPERALLRVAALVAGHGSRLGPAFVPVAVVLFFLAGLLWALPYALWAEPRMPGPDWLKGALFSLLPTLVSWLVVLPLLGAGPLGLALAAGPVPAAGEAVRHLIYGAALGLAYPVLLLARRPWHPRHALAPPAAPLAPTTATAA